MVQTAGSTRWEARRLSCAETAKVIRAALKRSFPGVTFRVRSKTYSGGASIRVRWMDGPTQQAVQAIAGQFQGGGFDGMIDLKYHVDSWLLPDGSAVIARSPGTEGSAGVVPSVKRIAPHDDAELVSFGADFVFCDRDYSRAALEAAATRVAERYGLPVPEVREWSTGSAYGVDAPAWWRVTGEPASTVIYRDIQGVSL